MNVLRHHTGRFALMLVVLLAVLAQGAMPAGFMPGRAGDGSASIVICTATGPATIAVGPEHNPLAGEHDTKPQKPPHCPFAPVLAQDSGCAPPVLSLIFTALRADVQTPADLPPRTASAHVYLAQGPPSLSA